MGAEPARAGVTDPQGRDPSGKAAGTAPAINTLEATWKAWLHAALFKIYFIEVELIYNVVLVPGVR